MVFAKILTWFTLFFNDFWGMIESFFGEVGTFFKMLHYAFKTVKEMGYSLPPYLFIFSTVTVLVSLIYMLLGRSTGGFKND